MRAVFTRNKPSFFSQCIKSNTAACAPNQAVRDPREDIRKSKTISSALPHPHLSSPLTHTRIYTYIYIIHTRGTTEKKPSRSAAWQRYGSRLIARFIDCSLSPSLVVISPFQGWGSSFIENFREIFSGAEGRDRRRRRTFGDPARITWRLIRAVVFRCVEKLMACWGMDMGLSVEIDG